MLQFMRKSVGSWLGIGILVLALGALVVTLFHPTDPVNTGGGGTVLASVGKRRVTEPEYQRSVERAVARERENNPQMTTPEFLRLGGGALVLDQMIQNEAVGAWGASNGMAISRRMVDGEIASIPALQVNGKFDEPTFRRLLAEQRVSEDELRRGIESDLARRQLLQPIALGTYVPQGLAEPFARLLLEARHGQILAIPAAAMPATAKPTDADLKSYYEANRRAYTLPERRGFRYATFDSASLASRAAATPAEIEAYYKEHAVDFGGVETRDVRQIVLADEKQANAFAADVKGGKDFVAAATALGWAEGDVSLGSVTKDALQKDTSAEVANAAFSLPSGGLSGVIRSPLGYHVVQVRSITPAKPRPLDSVRGEIAAKVSAQKLQDLLSDTVAHTEDRFQDGQTLADVAKDMGLELKTAAPVTADGRQFSADYVLTRFDQPQLLSHIFDSSSEDGPQVADLGGGHYALFEISDTVPPALVPLDRIRDDVTAAWEAKQHSDAAKKLADDIAARAEKGEKLATLATASKLPPPQQISVRRLELTQMAQQGQKVPPPVLMLLSTAKGQARVVAAPGNQGYFVVQVDGVEPGDLAQVPQLAGAVRQGMQREAADEMVSTFLHVIERSENVVRNPDAIRAADRRMAGAGQ